MRFEHEGDWFNHFSKEIWKEAKAFYAASLQKDEYGQGRAAANAWIYALGASRFMQNPEGAPKVYTEEEVRELLRTMVRLLEGDPEQALALIETVNAKHGITLDPLKP